MVRIVDMTYMKLSNDDNDEKEKKTHLTHTNTWNFPEEISMKKIKK